MSLKLFSFIAIIVALIIGAAWFARPNGDNVQFASVASQTKNSSVLVASETIYDFGEISMGKGVVQHKFVIKNNSADLVTITKIQTSCMCTKATLVQGERRTGPFSMPGHGFVPSINRQIAPGEQATIEAVFDPAAHGPSGIGPIVRSIYIEELDGATIELRIKAMVKP